MDAHSLRLWEPDHCFAFSTLLLADGLRGYGALLLAAKLRGCRDSVGNFTSFSLWKVPTGIPSGRSVGTCVLHFCSGDCLIDVADDDSAAGYYL